MHHTALRLVLIGSTVAATACSSSPTILPSPTSPSNTPAAASTEAPATAATFEHLAGIWKGFLKITESTTWGVGVTVPFTLRIAGDPQSYAGQFDLASDHRSPAHNINVGLAGRLREDGFVMLSGTSNFGAFTFTSADVSELLVKTDDSSGLAGTIRFGQRGPGFNTRFTAQILSASLQPTSAYPGGVIEGHWIGLAIIRACSGMCGPLYAPTWTREIELVLQQSGSALSGRGTFGSNGCHSPGCWLPLVGTADGASITSLTGRREHELLPGQYGDHVMVLSDFSATVDDLGRMRAQFVYSSEGQYIGGDPNRPTPGASRLNMESLWLTRQP